MSNFSDNPGALSTGNFECVLRAWQAHEAELLNFLTHQLHDHTQAEDLLQEIFLKSMRAGKGFCELLNPRAWLYRVAKTTLIDHARSARHFVELPDDLAAQDPEHVAAVDQLDGCLMRNLVHLSDDDSAIVLACDLHGQTVREFAQAKSLGLPAAKSRLLRARQRLRQFLVENCQVQFDDSGQVCCHSLPPGVSEPLG